MSYWDYEEPMWEPSEADELFDEIKSKLIDAAKDSLKSDMESLKRRNEYLEKRNKELEDKSLEVSRKESDLEYKSRNLRREVEKEFYKSIKVINALGTADGMIILIKILGSSLYMISSVMMLLKSEINSHMVKILGLHQKKNVKNIVIG